MKSASVNQNLTKYLWREMPRSSAEEVDMTQKLNTLGEQVEKEREQMKGMVDTIAITMAPVLLTIPKTKREVKEDGFFSIDESFSSMNADIHVKTNIELYQNENNKRALIKYNGNIYSMDQEFDFYEKLDPSDLSKKQNMTLSEMKELHNEMSTISRILDFLPDNKLDGRY